MRTLAVRTVPLALGLCFTLATCAQPEPDMSGMGGAAAGEGGAGYGTGGGSGSGGAAGVGGARGTGGAPGTGTGGESATGTGGAGAGTGGMTLGGGTGGHTGTGGMTAATGTGGAGTGGMTLSGGTGGHIGTGGMTATTGAGGSSGTVPPSMLPTPPGTGNVAQPAGMAGNVTVVNWAGFKGAVSYSLDDDNDTQIANYSTLEAQGIPYTFYMWANRTEASNSVWVQAVKDGHEIGNHTWSHQSAPPGGAQDITMATTFIMQHLNVTPYTMAAPNGAAVYTGLANGLFMINRGVSDAIVKPNDNTDRFTLPCYIPPTGAPASDFNSEVDSAQSAGGWRIILVHGFTGGANDGAYQPVALADYTSGIQHTKSLGNMWIGTIVDVGAYWLGQKAFSSATTTMTGTAKTWTWTKPSNFPPGKYLRVTVPGGTVTQNGLAVPWNSHGYYEISLDAGSVTVQ